MVFLGQSDHRGLCSDQVLVIPSANRPHARGEGSKMRWLLALVALVIGYEIAYRVCPAWEVNGIILGGGMISWCTVVAIIAAVAVFIKVGK